MYACASLRGKTEKEHKDTASTTVSVERYWHTSPSLPINTLLEGTGICPTPPWAESCWQCSRSLLHARSEGRPSSKRFLQSRWCKPDSLSLCGVFFFRTRTHFFHLRVFSGETHSPPKKVLHMKFTACQSQVSKTLYNYWV